MYLSETKLPHLLTPGCYHEPAWFEKECHQVLHPAWHVVGTRDALAPDGAFLTTKIAGIPVIVRNFSGELRAFHNVCAHRHCLLTGAPAGVTPTLRCQYHGWEYGADGKTRAIPLPRNFVSLDREIHRLQPARVATCGALVLVSVQSSGESLEDAWGADFLARCEERFGSSWGLARVWRTVVDVNWKIPVENTLESYHVPSVHPGTFRDDPGTERSQHRMGERHSSFHTTLPFSLHSRLDAWFQRFEGRQVQRWGWEPTAEYSHHHVFPSTLCSFTDTLSLVQSVIPLSPTRTELLVMQFGRLPREPATLSWLSARLWGRVAAMITGRILNEDLRLYADIQAGLQASLQSGVLGICEERIHAFQKFVQSRCSSALVCTDVSGADS